jgi:hypothetical protein
MMFLPLTARLQFEAAGGKFPILIVGKLPIGATERSRLLSLRGQGRDAAIGRINDQ